MSTSHEACEQLPTIPGKVEGIVGLDPLRLQCRGCGRIHTGTRGVAFEIITSGFHFHLCEGRGGIRRCPECLARVRAECASSRCRGDA